MYEIVHNQLKIVRRTVGSAGQNGEFAGEQPDVKNVRAGNKMHTIFLKISDGNNLCKIPVKFQRKKEIVVEILN